MIDAHLFFIKIASILRQNRARELNLILRVTQPVPVLFVEPTKGKNAQL